MADVRYRVDIDTRSAQSAINGLGNTIKTIGATVAGAFAFKEISTTGAKLDDLRRTFGTLFGDLERGGKAFRDTQSLAQRLGLDIDQLATTVIKLKSAGIEPTVAQLKLFSDVSKSSVDSMGALQAVTDLFTRTMAGGLGLEDLERLQDRGIPVYTILAEKAGIARNQISELGQTMEGAARIRGILSEGLNELFGGATEARANSLSTAFTKLQNALQQSTDTLVQGGFGQALADIVNGLANWINANQALIGQVAGGFGKAVAVVIQNVEVLVKVLAALAAAAVTTRLISMAVALYDVAKAMKAAAVAGTLLQGVTGVGLVKATAGLAAATGAIFTIDKMFADATDGAEELRASVEQLNQQMVEMPNTELEIFKTGEIEKGINDFSDLNDKLKTFRLEQDMILINFAKQNSERRQSINLETELLGASREYSELRRAEADLLSNLQDQVLALQEAKAKLTAEEKKEGRVAVIDATIEKLREQYQADLEATQAAIRNSEARKAAYEIEQYAVRESQRQQDALRDTYDRFRRQQLNTLEQAYYDIELAANASARAQKRAMEEQLGRELTPEESQKVLEIARRNNEKLKQQHKELYDQSRTFSAGWNRAWKRYQEDATNAAKTAERVFEKATQGMEDALVDFVKTGKFEWRDFVNMMLEELLRSQIKQLMASIFNPGQIGGGGGGGFISGGGIGGAISSLAPAVLGGGSGGGGGGGNILGGLGNAVSGISKVVSGIGNIFKPGGGIGGGSSGGIGGAIGKVFGGVKSFFGFANGGMIPNNSPVLVGERGPELLIGAGGSNVIPNSSLGQSVNYYITAVDAPSFQQLVARDPGFIHAVAEQGRRRQPIGRR